MVRATYKGESGFKRYVGWSVITKNLFSIARWQERHQIRGGMMPKTKESSGQRRKLLNEIQRLAEVAVFGTLSETYRTCGRPGCHCQGGDPNMVRTYQLPRREGQDYRILRSASSRGRHTGRSGGLAEIASLFARTGGDE
jgi:hypothetical protein